MLSLPCLIRDVPSVPPARCLRSARGRPLRVRCRGRAAVTAQRPSSCQTWSLPPPPPREEIRRRPNAVPRRRPTRRLPPGPAPLAGLYRLPASALPALAPDPLRAFPRPLWLALPPARPLSFICRAPGCTVCLRVSPSPFSLSPPTQRGAPRTADSGALLAGSALAALSVAAPARAASATSQKPRAPPPWRARPLPPLSPHRHRGRAAPLSRPGPEAVSLRAPVSARGAAPPVTPRPSPAARPQPGAHTKRRSAITRRGPVHHLIPSPRAPTRAPSPPRPKNTAPDSSLSEGVCGGTVLITRFAREI